MRPHAAVSNSHENCWDRLHLRAQDLFVESKTHSTIGCLQYSYNGEGEYIAEAGVESRPTGFLSTSINDIPGLDLVLKANNQALDISIRKRIQMFFISQTTSWSRLRISPEMFDRVVQFCKAFEEFSTCVLQFGRRIQDAPEMSLTSHMRLHTNRSSVIGFEICYNIKHFELHGRELKDPWSCRHAAFYQRYSSAEHLSTWIIIQGPSKIKSFIERSISAQASVSPTYHEHPLYLHAQFLILLERNWTSYLITLEEQRCKTNDKILFLSPGTISVELQDVHDIHNIQAKLRTAIAMIERIISVINTVVDLCNLLQDHKNQGFLFPSSLALSDLVIAELKQFLSIFQSHMRTATKILQSSEDVKVMILAIIAYRHNDAIRMHTSSLDSFTARASTERERRTEIAGRALLESSIIRIATLITVFYLPFNLTTAFFSTNLITFQENGSIRVRKSIWVFIVTTFIVSGGTAIAFWVWKRIERVGRRKNATP